MHAGTAAPEWAAARIHAARKVSSWPSACLPDSNLGGSALKCRSASRSQRTRFVPHSPHIALAALRQPDQPDPTFPAWLSSPLSLNPNLQNGWAITISATSSNFVASPPVLKTATSF
jgi:hypothetical protein